MTTTSRGISKKLKHGRGSSTPGKTKGAFCVRHLNIHTAVAAVVPAACHDTSDRNYAISLGYKP